LAFSGCWILPSICIPSSVRSISAKCFHGCTNLQRVTFETGSRLARFEEKVFQQCPSVLEIHIPSSIEGLFSEYRSKVKLTDARRRRNRPSR
jgi:hypothetical protein